MGTILGLFVLALALLLAAHLVSLGSPYVEMRYCEGRPRYYVWVRRFGGFDDLVGTCETEEEAHQLKGRVLTEKPGIR